MAGFQAPTSETSEVALTGTGHVVGATYRCDYWGGTYKVIGSAPSLIGKMGGVEVECVTPGGGAHQTSGVRWTHCTDVGKDVRVDAVSRPAKGA